MAKADPAGVLRNVLYPKMRQELADHLRFLLQLGPASENIPSQQGTEFSFSCAVDFILNDTKLRNDTAAAMGWFLKSAAEVQSLRQLAIALDKIVPRRSQNRLQDARRNEAEWPGIAPLAHSALKEMERSDAVDGQPQ